MELPHEVNVKLDRVREFIEKRELSGVLLKTQANFSWLTAGGSNAVGIATEAGVTSLLVTEDRLYLIANTIEAPRMSEEEHIEDLGFTILVHDWFEDRELELVEEVVGAGRVGCDLRVTGTEYMGPEIARMRYELTPEEIDRYMFMGAKVAAAVEHTLSEVEPGDTEAEITGRLCARLWGNRIDTVGYITAADERIQLYRHPIPTLKPVEKCAMLGINARYHGLIMTITRMVHFGPVPESLMRQYKHNLEIECAMIAATRVGRPVKDAFLRGVELYSKLGYGDEWKLHHQGGAMGYTTRDIKATPRTPDFVARNQAFCWNPTISGTKTEDGFIATPEGPRMISSPVIFPVVEMSIDGVEFERPSILVR